jgi:uncharacterized protein (TIGR02444 family)
MHEALIPRLSSDEFIPRLSSGEFFDYSLQFYFQGSNQENLMLLQDNADLNINIVLLMMYLRTINVGLTTDDIYSINDNNQILDSLTSNIRQKRRSLKADNIAQGLTDYRTLEYEDLLAQELALEKKQQDLMIDLAKSFGSQSQACVTIGFCDDTFFASMKSLAGEDPYSITRATADILEELLNAQKKLASTFVVTMDD